MSSDGIDSVDLDGNETLILAIRDSVRAKAGEGHFLGVTVQPMVKSEGYELILGLSIDSQFGPVLLFGAGGQLVEVFQDRARLGQRAVAVGGPVRPGHARRHPGRLRLSLIMVSSGSSSRLSGRWSL